MKMLTFCREHWKSKIQKNTEEKEEEVRKWRKLRKAENRRMSSCQIQSHCFVNEQDWWNSRFLVFKEPSTLSSFIPRSLGNAFSYFFSLFLECEPGKVARCSSSNKLSSGTPQKNLQWSISCLLISKDPSEFSCRYLFVFEHSFNIF